MKTDDLIGRRVAVLCRHVLPRHGELDKVEFREPVGILRKDWRGNLYLDLDGGGTNPLTDEIITIIILEEENER